MTDGQYNSAITALQAAVNDMEAGPDCMSIEFIADVSTDAEEFSESEKEHLASCARCRSLHRVATEAVVDQMFAEAGIE